jgi:HD-GYP domain-containing protein (c-di-GMP phosphodiesterase class II)
MAAPTLVGFDVDANELIEQTRLRALQRLSERDFCASLVLAAGFLAAAVAMAVVVSTDRPVSPSTIALLVLAYAITSRVEFEVGTGSALPTELILVPMLFLAPIGAVPLLVALGLLLGRAPALLARKLPPDRILLLLVNSWHAVGPALVIGLLAGAQPSWRHWPIYVAALAAQFAFDIASSGTRERLALGLPLRTQLRFMRWAFVVDAMLAPVALGIVLAQPLRQYSFLLVMPLVGLLAAFARERQARVDHALELNHAYQGTAFLLGEIVEWNNAYTGLHSKQVVSLAAGVAHALGLGARQRRNTEFAALLHDVGKIRVPPEIINKAGPLTDDERRIVQRHTIEGERILVQVGGLLADVGHIVRSSHERFDGTGYPDGLAADQIPLTARIVACCDALSAMVTDRPYRRALPVDAAIAELRAGSGRQFDPRVVESLERLIASGGDAAAILGEGVGCEDQLRGALSPPDCTAALSSGARQA